MTEHDSLQKTLNVNKYSEKEGAAGSAEVIVESPVTVFVNDVELVTLLCLGRSLDYLAAGFLWTENVIAEKADIKSIEVDLRHGVVKVVIDRDEEYIKNLTFKRLVTTACGKGSSFYTIDSVAGKLPVNISPVTVSPKEVIPLVAEFEDMSELHERTRGVHSALLAEGRKGLIFHDDIGRHNAIDKVLGHALLDGVPVTDKMVLTSGRISSEVLLKVAKKGVPALVSRAQPTDLAVSLADQLGLTLIGYVRKGSMNVYTHPERVKL
ncbi:MAG: formate dehydrogenase accessory sulfurtransferase FdhD [Actinomycetota bacterium]